MRYFGEDVPGVSQVRKLLPGSTLFVNFLFSEFLGGSDLQLSG